MVQDKYVGLALAVLSTLGIGTSFVITKKGLIQSQNKHGFEGEGFSYLKNGTWWAGMILMALGEIANFAAYAFAPAILVTPLGALSVLIGSVLGAYFLDERLGLLGKIGCAICLIGSVIIVLHAPPDKNVESINKILELALSWGFLTYCVLVSTFAVVMIYKIAPKYGKKSPLVYISICSTVGSVSIMAIKAFGIAVKLTLGGDNQFKYASTYVFMIIVGVCLLTQMNYFNKALSQFSTNLVNPLYYVTFTTFTLIASFLLFKGFNTTTAVNTISLLCGFLIIFSGVYLLNLSREDPDGMSTLNRGRAVSGRLSYSDGIPTDGLTGLGTRRSMQARRSSSDAFSAHLPLNSQPSPRHYHDRNRRSSVGDSHGPNGTAGAGDREALMRGYDDNQSQQTFGLSDLAEDSDEETEMLPGRKRTSFDREQDEVSEDGKIKR